MDLTMSALQGENGEYVLERLNPETTYDFRFAAKNLVGYGQWGAGIQLTTPRRGPPMVPAIMINEVRNARSAA